MGDKIEISKIVPIIEQLLNAGKTVQLQLNTKTKEVKILESQVKKIKL